MMRTAAVALLLCSIFAGCAIFDTEKDRNWNFFTKSGATTGANGPGGTPVVRHIASRVYGQLGSYTCGVQRNNGSCVTGGVTANNLFQPTVAAPDGAGGLYVSDSGNNRVLYYAPGSTTATRVYGQFGNFGCNIANNNGSCAAGPPSATNLNIPYAVSVDSADGLYVADLGNARVLFFPSGSTTATRVYGQFGSFTCNLPHNNGSCAVGSPSANSLSGPTAAIPDSSGGLYITDHGNHRVLYYASGSTTASRVYGQFGSFACNAAYNNGSCAVGPSASANNLYYPLSSVPDTTGKLYIIDRQQCRVLSYLSSSTTASSAYGTNGSLTTACGGLPVAASFSYPRYAAPDTLGGVYIADSGLNRVLYFSAGDSTPSQVYGQFGSYTCSSSSNNGSCVNGTPSAENLSNPTSVNIDGSGGLYITDYDNNRVLYFSPGT